MVYGNYMQEERKIKILITILMQIKISASAVAINQRFPPFQGLVQVTVG